MTYSHNKIESSETDSDLFFLGDDDDGSKTNHSYWKVLIVDDEEEIHVVTRMVLKDFQLDNKGVNLISAYSGAEAKELLLRNPDIAVILLDVVMEVDSAGLEVAEFIRTDLGNPFIRIILRTGQPGQAPEKEIIDNYEVNDYKEKTELTSVKLYTALAATLRAYRDLMLIEQHKVGLWRIIKASTDLFAIRDMTQFTTAVLQQLTGLLRLDDHAVFCKAATGVAAKRSENASISFIAGTGDYANYCNKTLPDDIVTQIQLALEEKKNLYFSDHYVAYFRTTDQEEHVLYIKNSKGSLLSTFDQEIIELFCSHIATAYTAVPMAESLEDPIHDLPRK